MFKSPMNRFAGAHGNPDDENMRSDSKQGAEKSPDHVDSGNQFTRQMRVQSHDDGHYSVGQGDDYEGDTHFEDLEEAMEHLHGAMSAEGSEYDGGEADENMASNSKGGKSRPSQRG